MKYINRDKSIVTGKKNLEPLYTIKNFPVFISYVENTDEASDMRADMSFSICPESGIIQLDKVLPLEIVYQAEHSVGMGKVWGDMYADFNQFISKYALKNILEIGGGNGVLAQLYTEKNDDCNWTIVEPLPLCEETKNIKIVKGWFDKDFVYKGQINAIVHSHTLEHIYEPFEFLELIYDSLKTGDHHFFSVPNLYTWLSKKYTNSINFEHTIFLTEYIIDYLVQKAGFELVEKKYYKNHSIFYATKRLEKKPKVTFEPKYDEYRKIFDEYIVYHNNLIKTLNKKMESLDGDIYLFGAHIFSQFLIEFGLDKSKIKGILDNSAIKQNKRLYGTPFLTESLEVIKSKKNVAVIVKAAEYQEEIRKQLLSINKNVVILE